MTDEERPPDNGEEEKTQESTHSISYACSMLLGHMGAEDGPSCNEEEKDAKRLRSASTAPGSARGTQPNDCHGYGSYLSEFPRIGEVWGRK